MPKCTAGQMEFGRLGRRALSADFDGGALSSDGGLMLLRRVDERIGLSRSVASALHDGRNPRPHHARHARTGGATAVCAVLRLLGS